MNTNPYQSPSGLSQASNTADVSVDGIWRDGPYLVLNVRGSQFPFRCVKTNEPVSTLTSQRIDWIPASLLAKIFVGLLLAKALWGKSVEVNIGLSDVILRRRRRLTRLGWGLALGGIISLVLFTFVYVAAMASGVQDSTGELLMYIPLVSAFAALGGIPVLVVAYIPVLRVKKWSRDQIWLSVAHPAFLNALPQWSRE
jgi:hypothetical protein